MRTDSTRHTWNDDEDQRLKAMLDADKSVPEIAAELQCTCGAVRSRKHVLGLLRFIPPPTRLAPHETRAVCSDPLALDRDLRQEARHRLDLTGQIFGDPPPGFSALDRRMGKVTA